MRRLIIPVVMLLCLAACTPESTSTPATTGTTPDGGVVVGDTAPPDTQPPPPICPATQPITVAAADEPFVEFLSSGDPGLASVSISQATFECATEVVAVDGANPNRVAIAALLAIDMGAPLLIASPGTAALISFELDRLAPETVVAVGDDVDVSPPNWTEIDRISGDTAALASAVNSRISASSSLPLPPSGGVSTLIATMNAIGSGAGLIPPDPPTTTTSTPASTTTSTVPVAAAIPEPEAVPGIVAGSNSTGVALLVDGNDTLAALVAIAAAEASGAVAALVDGRDLRRVPEAGRALRNAPNGSIHVLADVTADAPWQLDVIRKADELPGGGFLVLPRLFIALYGNPLTGALGVLGEQSAEEAVIRARSLAAQYEASDAPVLPTFEIIATVAAADIGPDGDYSNEMTSEVIQPWIDVAAAEQVYVILDLQPGRDDFLSQAMEYEQYLLEPHVGLALDPEWRLKPSQFHLQQIGRVDAAEVNQVIEWLAALVRDNDLPQKVLLLHQFRFFMIENRETLQTPPELQLIIQMDGLGAVSDKYLTWEALTEGWETHPWAWGWKSFYDEDLPGPIPPSEALELVPYPVLISYQ